MHMIDELVDVWRVNDSVTQALLRGIPEKGLAFIPPASRGRNVSEQFRHLQRVRAGWLRANRHSSAMELEMFRMHTKGAVVRKKDLLRAFAQSGKEVERYLRERLTGGKRIMFFGGRPVRWLAYMIAHESHHRGQILLALKQNGMRLPEKISINEVWYRWYRAKGK
jgi:uncharacterized damage-inducible protein DinB